MLFSQLRGYDNICLLNANDADVFDFIQVKENKYLCYHILIMVQFCNLL